MQGAHSLQSHERLPDNVVLSREDPGGEPRIPEEQQLNMAVLRMAKAYNSKYWQFEAMLPPTLQPVVNAAVVGQLLGHTNGMLRSITDEYQQAMLEQTRAAMRRECGTAGKMSLSIMGLAVFLGGGLSLDVLSSFTSIPGWIGPVLIALGVVAFFAVLCMAFKSAYSSDRERVRGINEVKDAFVVRLDAIYYHTATALTSQCPGVQWVVRDALVTVIRTSRNRRRADQRPTISNYSAKARIQYLVALFNGATYPGVPPYGGYLAIDGRLRTPEAAASAGPAAASAVQSPQHLEAQQSTQPPQYVQPQHYAHGQAYRTTNPVVHQALDAPVSQYDPAIGKV